MGANMILAICRVPEELTGAEISRLEERARRLREERPERFEEVCEDVLNAEWRAVEEAEAGWEEAGLPEAEVESRRRDLHDRLVGSYLCEAIAALLRPLVEGSGRELDSDVILHGLDGNRYLMSGGPTSGDPPTYSYDHVQALDASGLLDQGEGAGPEAATPVLHLYMDRVTARRRADEWVAECMVHSEDGEADATVAASAATEEGARGRLWATLGAMRVRTVHGKGYWGEE